MSPKINLTVMPMILRGVSLLGVSSANCEYEVRKKVWQKIFTTLTKDDIEVFLSEVVNFDQLYDYSNQMIANKLHGRYLGEA